MDWSSLLTLAVIGLMFYLMMRHGGGCCGDGHPPTRGGARPPSEVDAHQERAQADRR